MPILLNPYLLITYYRIRKIHNSTIDCVLEECILVFHLMERFAAVLPCCLVIFGRQMGHSTPKRSKSAAQKKWILLKFGTSVEGYVFE